MVVFAALDALALAADLLLLIDLLLERDLDLEKDFDLDLDLDNDLLLLLLLETDLDLERDLDLDAAFCLALARLRRAGAEPVVGVGAAATKVARAARTMAAMLKERILREVGVSWVVEVGVVRLKVWGRVRGGWP